MKSTAESDDPARATSSESRKARKRATDRRAQREHRLRQKAYVKQLEESVKSLSAGSQDELVRSLLAEQARLHEQCNDLKAKLDRVRSIVCEDRLHDACQSGQDSGLANSDPPPKSVSNCSGDSVGALADEDFERLLRNSNDGSHSISLAPIEQDEQDHSEVVV